ncbi:MAG TPA: hypothetical protein VFX59_25375 [Polyangiales bacterium]|nr:hypothetical protein [Polyangiales bacterium]
MLANPRSMSRTKANGKKSKAARAPQRMVAPVARAGAITALEARARELNLSSEQSAFVASLLASFAQLGSDHDVLASERDGLASERDGLVNERTALAAELARAELRIKKLLFVRYGHSTEKLTRDELMQLVLSFGATQEQAEAQEPEVPHAPAPDEPVEQSAGVENAPASPSGKPKKKRPNHPGRTALSPELERIFERKPLKPLTDHLAACASDSSTTQA